MTIFTQIVEILENSGISYEISKNSTGISVNFSESLEISQETTETSTPESDYPPKPDGEGWISNQGNGTCIWIGGYGIKHTTLLEFVYRDGSTSIENAEQPTLSWRETDGTDDDIVWFRIVK